MQRILAMAFMALIIVSTTACDINLQIQSTTATPTATLVPTTPLPVAPPTTPTQNVLPTEGPTSTLYVEPTPPPVPTDSPVPATATSIPATATPTVACKPIYLLNMQTVGGDSPGRGVAIIDGQSYPHSLLFDFGYNCCSDEHSTDYQLDGRFGHFLSSIGPEDDSVFAGLTYEVFLDHVRLGVWKTPANELPVDIDVSNGGLLQLQVTSACGIYCEGTASFGDARLTCP